MKCQNTLKQRDTLMAVLLVSAVLGVEARGDEYVLPQSELDIP